MMLSMSEIVSESENAPPKAVSKTASKPSTEPKIDSGAAASMERFWYLSSLESHLNDLTCKQRNELLHVSIFEFVPFTDQFIYLICRHPRVHWFI